VSKKPFTRCRAKGPTLVAPPFSCALRVATFGQDRTSAICQFCDTDFIGTNGEGGGKFETAVALANHVSVRWPDLEIGQPYVVCTGGEPLLQLDAALIDALHAKGFEIAVETNGTIDAPRGIDWICVSPKAGSILVQKTGHEIKLVYPQHLAPPEMFAQLDFGSYYLQPMDGPEAVANTNAAIAYCLKNPHWRLSLQTHKMLGIP
jgi:7-carboxy-7-deazaguanine synthase